jgi:hypothetical protein
MYSKIYYHVTSRKMPESLTKSFPPGSILRYRDGAESGGTSCLFLGTKMYLFMICIIKLGIKL